MEDKKIVVEELEAQTEQKQEAKAENLVQSFGPSQIGGLFFTENGLTIFPKGYMEKFSMERKEGLIGKESKYDYSQVAGALERVVTLEKENSDLKAKIAKLEASVKTEEKKDEEKKEDVKAEVKDEKKLTPEEEEKKKLEEEKKKQDEAAKMEEKKTAVAKSVQAQAETKTEAEHSNVDDDIRRLMGGLKKAREDGKL
jgi:hypothetical protein